MITIYPFPTKKCYTCLSDDKSQRDRSVCIWSNTITPFPLTFDLEPLQLIYTYDLTGEFGGLNEKTARSFKFS